MMQPPSLMARWRQARWRHDGERCLTKTLWPGRFALGSIVEHRGVRYRITRYDVTADQSQFEVWARPVGTTSASRSVPITQPLPNV